MEVGIVMLLMLLAPPAAAAAQGDPPPPKAQTFLFMCPHGAAKSVLASTYFEGLAKERGLSVRVRSAGTDPDPAVSPKVAEHLARLGYSAPAEPPRQPTAEELATADVVISLGCDLSGLPQPGGRVIRWDEVPSLSDDFARADAAIRKRVMELIAEVAESQRQK